MGQAVESAVDPQQSADGGNDSAVFADDPAGVNGGHRQIDGRPGFGNRQLVGFGKERRNEEFQEILHNCLILSEGWAPFLIQSAMAAASNLSGVPSMAMGLPVSLERAGDTTIRYLIFFFLPIGVRRMVSISGVIISRPKRQRRRRIGPVACCCPDR